MKLCVQGVRTVAARGVSPRRQTLRETVRCQLEQVRSKDPRCVLIIRRLRQLGFRPVAISEAYHSQHGQVAKVFVAHSRLKAVPNKGSTFRMRPGSFGIMLMLSSEAVCTHIGRWPRAYSERNCHPG